MKKILLNRKPLYNQAWGGGNLFVKAMCEHAEEHGYEIVHKLEPGLDAILLVDPRYDELGISVNEVALYKTQNPKTRVVHRVNECDARKSTSDMDELLVGCSKITDATVFVSNWMKEYFGNAQYRYARPEYEDIVKRKGGPWRCEEQYVVYNGVNHEHFRPKDSMLLTTDAHVCRIVAHHWSNNQLKGFDIYDKLDKWVGENPGYEFIYIGRSQGKFKNAKIIDPLFGKALGDELRQYDVYVSASRWDPGPNHVIESLACGLPTFVHADGGGALEFADIPGASYSSFEELVLKIKQREYWPSQDTWKVSWKECADQYFQIIKT